MKILQRLMITASLAGLVFVIAACQSAPEPSPTTEPPTIPESPAEEELPEQPQTEPTPPPEPEEPTEEQRKFAEQITDEDLQRFAEGVRAVGERERQLREEGRDFESLRAEATGPVDVRQAEQEVLGEMADALAEVELEWESFIQFAGVVRANPILMERLREFLDDEEIRFFYGE